LIVFSKAHIATNGLLNAPSIFLTSILNENMSGYRNTFLKISIYFVN